ncbi:HAD-IC family P-type ATPase [Pseudoxanthomonas mexicana]|uniref:HAD-IC family P-type ATPase n=1 Tax=Pseudoxanthomonas mexicana TaxID=128785 RepID=UPI00398AE5A1
MTDANLPSRDGGAPAWHAMEGAQALQALRATEQGLQEAEASQRLRQHGRNELPPPPKRSPLRRLLEQFNNALILFLLSAAVLSALLGHTVDAVVIVAVVLVNAVVGFVQEGRAEQALAALQALLAPSARVLRDGARRVLPVGELVPGDIVLLEAGDRVPADLRLLHARGLLVDEAILTGESVAAEKTEAAVAADAALGDRLSMAYSGTLVASGQASGVVTATGAATEMGHINALLGSVQTLTTPLLRQINAFGRRFTALAIAAAAVLFVFAIALRGYAWLDALMVVVALAVSVVPEGLPAVITITLAIGVRRMAARHAIVRRLPAVETLGATSVICSDKTGTLTRNEMTARRVVTAAGTTLASGAGYAPAGVLSTDKGDAEPDAAARQLILCGLLCNDAHLRERDGQWTVDGDPMEGALLALALKAGLEPDSGQADRPRVDAIPFDASYRYMATLHRVGGAEGELFVKGAPEQVMALSPRQWSVDGGVEPLDRAYWEAAIADAAAQGERVLGFAMRRLPRAPARLGFADVSDLVFLGVVGFIDPPREEAMAAVAECHSAGIAVKMITGDHAATAAAIAQRLGLADAPVVVAGADLDGVPDEALPALAEKADVFARASPEHKLRVVRALQSRGAVVAMTGDGVNDAPSLKQADVGIAMGRKGTEAAKEAAEMVLSDDNFASIAAAVHEGRTVYDNIRKVVAWTLPTNGGEVLAIVAALAFGLTLPMTPPQILWVNMILTVTLGLVLAFEPPEPGVMRRPPRRPDALLVSPFMLWRIVLVSVLFTLGAFGVFAWAMQRGLGVEAARTMVVNTLCVMEIFYLFNVRYLHTTSFTLRGLRGTPAVLWAIAGVVAAQLLFTYAPWMNHWFDTRPVAFADGVVIVLIGVAVMVLLEAEKTLLRRLDLFEELRADGAADIKTKEART